MLTRISQEGWAERRPGYGWEFSEMLVTPEALLQTYRVRMALEPAALLEPGYRLAPAAIERLRATELRLSTGRSRPIARRVHERGVRFHEGIVGACRNPFFLDALRRINRVRRLLSYRSMVVRDRYREQCREHLDILGLLEAGPQHGGGRGAPGASGHDHPQPRPDPTADGALTGSHRWGRPSGCDIMTFAFLVNKEQNGCMPKGAHRP